jgi:hypothetical protein
MKDGFNKAWFVHPLWQEANNACIHATGGELYTMWNVNRGCTNSDARGWMIYAQVAQSIASLCFGYEYEMDADVRLYYENKNGIVIP